MMIPTFMTYHENRNQNQSMRVNKYIIYTDGGARGNPGPAGIGVVIKGPAEVKKYGEYIGEATNNEAEWNLKQDFKKVIFEYIPREDNRGADKLVNQALDQELSKLEL